MGSKESLPPHPVYHKPAGCLLLFPLDFEKKPALYCTTECENIDPWDTKCTYSTSFCPSLCHFRCSTETRYLSYSIGNHLSSSLHNSSEQALLCQVYISGLICWLHTQKSHCVLAATTANAGIHRVEEIHLPVECLVTGLMVGYVLEAGLALPTCLGIFRLRSSSACSPRVLYSPCLSGARPRPEKVWDGGGIWTFLPSRGTVRSQAFEYRSRYLLK